MDYLPLFFNIRGKTVLVEGDGTVAARRTERALNAGAKVRLFSPSPVQEIVDQFGRDGLIHFDRTAEPEDLEGCTLVFGASDDAERDEALITWAREKGILCNITDCPGDCDVIVPSIVERAPITVAISTGGAAPVIARILRARLEAMLPPAFGRLAEFGSAFRERIADIVPAGRARRRFWEHMIDGPAGDAFLFGDTDRATDLVTKALASAPKDRELQNGEVYLVGSGPGDPDLLTFRALRLMQRCDVVLYDRLVGEDIMALVRRDAERVYVGKMAKNHTMVQEDIQSLMVRLAKEGKRVLRLKGGDPFIFGRGGEEIEELAAAGIPFQVVPGVTAAAGCGAYAGIPLTHRDHAQAVIFATAHGKDGVLNQNWPELVRPGQTVVVYMGLHSMDVWMTGLRDHGIAGDTPVAVVDNGTRANQTVVIGTVDDVETRVAETGIKGPAVVIIGSVVTLRDQLNWYKHQGASFQMGLGSVPTDKMATG